MNLSGSRGPGSGGPPRARGRRLRHVVLDGQPARRGARRPGDQAGPSARERRRRRAARHAARPRDARASSRHRRRVASARASSRSSISLDRLGRGEGMEGIAGHGVSRRRAASSWARAPGPRGARRARVAARLLRYAHRDDVARLPLALHVLRRGGQLGARLPRRSRCRTCSTRSRRPSARLPVKMIQIKDDTFTTNRKRVLELCTRDPRAQPPVLLELRHARRRARRRAAARDAPRGLRAPEPRRRVGVAEDPRRDRQEDHRPTRSSSRARSRRSTGSRSATT